MAGSAAFVVAALGGRLVAPAPAGPSQCPIDMAALVVGCPGEAN